MAIPASRHCPDVLGLRQSNACAALSKIDGRLSFPRTLDFSGARWHPLADIRFRRCCYGSRETDKFVTQASVHENMVPSSQQQGSNNNAFGYLQPSPSPANASTSEPNLTIQRWEEFVEQAIFNCRFFTLMGVAGSLAGSVLCFFKGCTFVVQSFVEYFQACCRGLGTGKVILLLVEAVDVYLIGTVMLIFGMGLYELFISSLDVPGDNCYNAERRATVCGSNLFGLFRLRERPKWLEIRSLDELKTKLGHVIVMILLVGMFEKSKKVPIHTGADLLFFSASILFSSGCLFLLAKLNSSK